MKRLSRLLWIHVALASLIAVLIVERAPAQGTGGVFPEPLDWQAFNEMSSPLALTDEQKSAIEPVHGAYLQEMLELRDGPISEFLEMESSDVFYESDDTAEEVDAKLDDFRRISKRFDSIERGFFDSIEPALGPNQLQRMEIVRSWRERHRMLNTSWPRMLEIGSIRPELRSMIPWQQLDAADVAAIEASLFEWEQTRTRLIRTFSKKRMEGLKQQQKLRSELGPVQLQRVAPEGEDRWLNYERERFARYRMAFKEAIETVEQIQQHGHRGLRTITALLPDRQARDLHWKYLKRLYYRGSGVDIRGALSGEIDSPPDDVDVEALELLLREHDLAVRPHLEKIMELTDDNENDSETFFPVTSEDDPISSHRKAIRKRMVTTARRMQDLLGGHFPKTMSMWLESIDNPIEEDLTAVAVVMDLETTGEDDLMEGEVDAVAVIDLEEVGGATESMDMLGRAPDPMAPEQIELLISDLGVDEDGRDVIEVLFETYTRNARKIESDFKNGQLNLMMKMAGNSRAMDDPESSQKMFVEMSTAIGTLQEAAMQSMETIDSQLFADLVLAVEQAEDQEVLGWHRQARQREFSFSSRGLMSSVMDMTGSEPNVGWKIDLMLDLGAAELPIESRRIVMETLRDWHGPTTTTVLDQAEHEAEIGVIMQQLAQMHMESGSSGMNPDDPDFREQLDEEMKIVGRMEELQQSVIDLREQQRRLNELYVARLVEALPVEGGSRINKAFKIASYPMVYTDHHAMIDKLIAASMLEDLDDPTRGSIHELQTKYEIEYYGYCDELTTLFESMPAARGVGFSMENIEQRKTDLQTANRIRFQRDDQSDKTRDRLQNLLTTDQIEAIGGLEKAKGLNIHWPNF